ncbi:MAG: hypothetical protein QM758_24165 [Armatimonas sp.]
MPFFRKPEPTLVAEFQDASIRVALQAIFDSANAQYSIAPEISGIVTIRRTQLPLRKLLAAVLSQAPGTTEIVEEKGVTVVRTVNGKPVNLSQLQQQLSLVESNAREKLKKLTPGTVLYRMSGYVKANQELQAILEIGSPPQSEMLLVKVGAKVNSGVPAGGELSVVRITEQSIWLLSEGGQPTKVPLASFRFYQP